MLLLNPASREDLEWWLTHTTAPTGAPVCPPDPSITVHTDASNQGWGAVLNGQSHTGGVWSPEEVSHHINYLELLAAFLAIKAFGKTWQNTSLTASGQCHSSELYKPERRHSVCNRLDM